MATIGIFNVGLGGHVRPTIRLAATMQRLGHDVLVWAPSEYRAAAEAAGARFLAHEPEIRPGRAPGTLAGALAEAADRTAAELIEEVFAAELDVAVHDWHAPWGRVAADFLGIPRIASNPLFPRPRAGSGKASPRSEAPPVPELPAEELERVERARRSIGRRFGVELGNWQSALVSGAETTFSFTTPLISGTNDLHEGWRYVGPLMDPLPSDSRRRRRPLVYVALGTFFNSRPEPFRAAIQGLAREPLDVLVSTGGGKVTAADLAPLPDNVTVQEFVDSRDVLTGASVHITHAGSGSVHESLLAGVPMVCLPQGSDQFAWCDRMVALGAGVRAEEEPATIREAALAMLEDRGWAARAHELGEEVAAFDPAPGIESLVDWALTGRM